MKASLTVKAVIDPVIKSAPRMFAVKPMRKAVAPKMCHFHLKTTQSCRKELQCVITPGQDAEMGDAEKGILPMTFKETARQTLAVGLAAQLLLTTQFATMAQAGMVGTEAAIQSEIAEVNRAMLLGEIRRDEVREGLIAQGVDPAEAEARLMALSDAEIARTLAQMDDGSAGAGAVGTLGMIFIILLVTDLLCLTRLFNFTRCVR
jgi:hypothetical protein